MDQNVYTPEDKYYDYPDRPVPHDKRKSPINIAVVTTGMAVAMSTLYTGSALAEVMNFKEGTSGIRSSRHIFSDHQIRLFFRSGSYVYRTDVLHPI